MISPKMLEALNAQATEEVASAYLYLAMSAWCEAHTMKGFGRWLRVQHAEELEHAGKIVDYVLARGGAVSLGPIAAPPREHGSVLQVFEAVLAHERKVAAAIEQRCQVAVAEKDTAAQVFLQWFVTEQVEEEAQTTEIIEKLRIVGEKSSAVLYLDKEYGKRTRGGEAG